MSDSKQAYWIGAEFFSAPLRVEVDGNTAVTENGEKISFERNENDPRILTLHTGEGDIPVLIRTDGTGNVTISLRGCLYTLSSGSEKEQYFQKLLRSSSEVKQSAVKIISPMPGLIKGIAVKSGQQVKKGENLFILEAMKMENIIRSPIAGTVQNLTIQEGNAVEKSAVLCVLEPQ